MFQLYLLRNTGKHSQKIVQSTKTDTSDALFFISDFLSFSTVINTKQVHSKFIIYLIFKILDSVSMQLVQYVSLRNLTTELSFVRNVQKLRLNLRKGNFVPFCVSQPCTLQLPPPPHPYPENSGMDAPAIIIRL